MFLDIGDKMNKKKIIIMVIVLAIGSIIAVVAINAVRYYDIINEPRLNLTKVQEHLDKGGSLDDPVTSELFEKNKGELIK
jgi:hypothetical protein